VKGIAHFATGLCLASFVPGVVESSAQGGWLIALGGIAGQLPDTLDFRIERFIERRSLDVVPDATAPDAQSMAEAVAAQMRATLDDGAPRIVQFHPLRRGVVDWVLYEVAFDSFSGNVRVAIDGGQSATAYVGPINYGYDGPIHIEELGGPSFKFARDSGMLTIEFLPWHRARTHSLLLALAFAAVVGTVLGPLAGIVFGLGYAGHVLEDQLGFMGSCLFWPLQKTRSQGAKLLHAADPAANMVAVWLSLSLLLFNLDRARAFPVFVPGLYLPLVVLLPAVLMVLVQARLVRHRNKRDSFATGDLQHDVSDARAA
jgi:hypothetical protein